MGSLYQQAGLTSVQIAELTGIPDRTVRDGCARGVSMRTRGRLNRKDRLAVPADALAELYVRAGLSAAETGRLLGVSRQVVLRTAHDEGLPVRVGGPAPRRGPAEIELIDALYVDRSCSRPLRGTAWSGGLSAAPFGSGSQSQWASVPNSRRNSTSPAGWERVTSNCYPGSPPRRSWNYCTSTEFR
jgi:hypothetical protein